MTKKYKVSQELMNEIDEWRVTFDGFVIGQDLMSEGGLPLKIKDWWRDWNVYDSEKNNRLIALIRYVNGEDVFEVEKPKKWVVRSKYSTSRGKYLVLLKKANLHRAIRIGDAYFANFTTDIDFAFKFNTKEEAEQFTNPLMEVVEWEEIAEGEFEDREFLELWDVEDE